MSPATAPVFPDAELAMLNLLAPAFPAYRFVTSMPATVASTIVRIHRISGADRGHMVDHPIVDVDVYSPDHGDASTAARNIQSNILSMTGIQTLNNKAVISRAITISGPRQLPEANPDITRMGATYELSIHNQQ